MKKLLLIFASAIIILLVGFTVYILDRGFLSDYRIFACDKLPAVTEVEKVMQEHQQTVDDIEELAQGVWISIASDTDRCPGKAHIQITYDTNERREKIKQMIGDSFFGIPYKMQNI